MLGEGSGQCHAAAALALGKTRHPLRRRLGGPQGQSGWVRKIPEPFRPQQVTVPTTLSQPFYTL